MGRLLDLTGQRFGKLTVIEFAGHAPNRKTLWKCKCDCGNETLVKTNALRSGATKSCGCLVPVASGDTHRKHGMSESRLYRTWKNMKARCSNERVLCYPHYGGRGIAVCEEWQNSFEAFRDWALANGYRDDLSIDRIDVNGDYCPGNCRWATIVEQNNNKRNNRFITLCGSTKTVAEWSRVVGIASGTIIARLRKGWGEYEAVFTPLLH